MKKDSHILLAEHKGKAKARPVPGQSASKPTSSPSFIVFNTLHTIACRQYLLEHNITKTVRRGAKRGNENPALLSTIFSFSAPSRLKSCGQ